MTRIRSFLAPHSSLPALVKSLCSHGKQSRLILLVLCAFGINLMMLAAPGYAQSPERLAVLEEAFQDDRLAFTIEEEEIGHIRNIIDYMLLHGRTHLQQGKTDEAVAEFQLAAGFMELNAGRGKTAEQEEVRRMAKEVEKLAKRIKSNGTDLSPRDVNGVMFNVHRALAQYHQRRAEMLLKVSEPPKRWPNIEVDRPKAVYQHKAGLALRAALVHFDKATTVLAQLQEMDVSTEHKSAVDLTYQFAEALKTRSGDVDARKAQSAIRELGRAIEALQMG